jgi:hypothetical protein
MSKTETVGETRTPGGVKAIESKDAKTTEPVGGVHVESVRQYLDEYSPEEALQMMRSHIAMSEDVRKKGVGRWELPPSHRHLSPPAYRFTRLGTMADVKRRDALLRQKFVLEQYGWKQAPRGTRNSLFLQDGDQGVYMCIAEVAALEQDAHEKKSRDEMRRRRFGKGVNRLPEDLQQLGMSMRVESVDVSQGRTSVDEFRKMR